MNTLDCYVTKVLSEPYEAYGKWWVKVEYDSWGPVSEGHVMCNSKEAAEAVCVGYHFVA